MYLFMLSQASHTRGQYNLPIHIVTLTTNTNQFSFLLIMQIIYSINSNLSFVFSDSKAALPYLYKLLVV